jgi:hypothetical protein
MELLLPPYFDKRSYFELGARARPGILPRLGALLLLFAVAAAGFYAAASLPDICWRAAPPRLQISSS